MPNYSDFGAVGSVILKKTAGSGPFTNSTQITLPASAVQPVRPRNISYYGVVAATDSLSNNVAGNITPAMSIRTYFHPSVFTAALINSLVVYTDSTTKNSDTFAVQINHQYKSRIFSLGKCAGIVFTQAASGGPIVVDMSFVFVYGQDYNQASPDDASPPTFTAASPVTGQFTNRSQVCFGSGPTADQVKGTSVALSRVQAYQFSDCTNGLFAESISSGMFGGAFTLNQSPTATTTPTSAVTVNLGGVGAGVSMALALNLDNPVTNLDTGFGVTQSGYTLYAGGTIPAVITAL